MNRKTLFLIVGLMVIALATVGVGYALWFEDLKVHGDVTTGDLDVDFSPFEIYQYFETCDNVPGGDVDDCLAKFEGITCTAEFANGAMGDQGDVPEPVDLTDLISGDPDYLGITVSGVYPSYTCRVTFDITSNGTVPVHLYAWYDELTSTFPVPPLECSADEWATIFTPDATTHQLVGVQLHEDDSIDCRVNIHFTNDDLLEEAATYAFQYHIRACQWNESDPATCMNFNPEGGYPFDPPVLP